MGRIQWSAESLEAYIHPNVRDRSSPFFFACVNGGRDGHQHAGLGIL